MVSDNALGSDHLPECWVMFFLKLIIQSDNFGENK